MQLPAILNQKSSEQMQAPETPLIKKSFWRSNKFILLSFAIPFLIMFFSFVCAKFYPFGDNQIMVIDMWHQFFEFFKLLHEKLQHGGSLLYSWNSALGTNMFSLTYYISSPTYLLSIFVPSEYLTEALAFDVVLKIALAGMFMCIYLRGMFGKCNFGTVTFSCFYALGAFSLGYYWCLMWLDALALLPLCMLGLNRLIDQGKFRLYTISLALIMIANYYIGVMVCMFIAIYYPVLYFSRKRANGAKKCLYITAKAVIFSAIALFISAIVILPTYFSMQQTFYIDQQFPTTDQFYHDILDIFGNLLPNQTVTIRGSEVDGLPNIYCGLLSFMMAILFLVSKKIPAKAKVLTCSILGFLILSCNWNKLEFIWHGFHFPNELPFRFSFTITFIIVTIAYYAFSKLDSITPTQIGAVTAGGFIYILLAEKLYDKFDYKIIYSCLALLFAYAIALALYKTGKFKPYFAGLMVFIIAFAELSVFAVSSVKVVGNSNRTTFMTSYDDVTGLVKEVEKNDDGFYRTEIGVGKWTTNDSALYGYKGVSVFSSQLNCKLSTFMKQIGLAADPGSNAFAYHISSPVVNSMLNLKYLIGRSSTINDYALTSKYSSNGSYIYENKYPLSIGYMTNADIIALNCDGYANPFEAQNQFLSLATGTQQSPYSQLSLAGDQSGMLGSNVSFGVYNNGTVYSSNASGSGTSTAQLIYSVTKDQPIYAYVSADGASSISAHTTSNAVMTYESNRGSVISLGSAKAGEQVFVDITFEEGKSGTISSYVYGFDSDIWDSIYSQMNDEALNVTSYSDTKIAGDITVNKDGILATSIPYEKGWSCKIDGKKVTTTSVSGAFVAVEMAAGKHNVVFSYCPQGFIPGTLMTIIGIAALIALQYVLSRRDDEIFEGIWTLPQRIKNKAKSKQAVQAIKEAEISELYDVPYDDKTININAPDEQDLENYDETPEQTIEWSDEQQTNDSDYND